MFQTTLIVGGDEQQRTLRVKQILSDERIVSFDTLFVSVEEGSTSIKIEQARVLIRSLTIPPIHSPWKVAVISELQRATVETQNALLKLLEEPPSFVRIVVTVDSTDKLLSTIVSRCHVLKLTAHSLPLTAQTDILFKSEAGERFAFAATAGKDRETAALFLKRTILSMRAALLSNYQLPFSQNTQYKILNTKVIRIFSRALSTLENTNTNPRLLVENLLLQL